MKHSRYSTVCWCDFLKSFFCFAQIINIYDHKKGVLSIGPFNYSTMDEIDLLCRLPDQFIREVGVYMNDRPKKDR